MMFSKLLALINKVANDGFFDATEKLNNFIYSTDSFSDILTQIGTIPKAIAHDSTEEKLFAKASDAVLSRAFRELGLKSTVLSERADSADVIAESPLYGYTLVADAKAFRLSRTAKNQKDFKVTALSGWRKDADYAVLCSPYFQYQRKQGQIYSQAIENNVCLLSWEHLMFMLKYKIKENEQINLSQLWNFSENLSHKTVVAKAKRCFIPEFNAECLSVTGLSQEDFDKSLIDCVSNIKNRGNAEKAYWEKELETIKTYSREKAITELIKSKKIDEKIRQIDLYIRGISRD